jgi:hypothetical protein
VTRPLFLFALVLMMACPSAVLAQGYPPSPSSFGAEPDKAVPTEAVAPDDFQGLLRNCDIVAKNTARELAACKQDATGVDFLGAAYLALWVILMVFFLLVRLRQRRLDEEIRALRDRLARLGDDAP